MSIPAAVDPATYHAPPGRLTSQDVARRAVALGDLAGLTALLDAMPDWVMLLNEQRQIVFGNRALRDFAGERAGGRLLGLRPGELLSCRQAGLAPSGCGTGEACRTCGSVNAILGALAGDSVMRECRVSAAAVTAYDLRIWASPFRWQTDHYALVVAVDIGNEKRREVLERIFFHDLLNTAGSLYGLSELIHSDPASAGEFKDDLLETAETLVNEIRTQRLLLAAESNELPVSIRPAQSRHLLESALQGYRHDSLANGRHLAIAPHSAAFTIHTDETLLHRVLGNLLKNALEASRPGDTVELGAAELADQFVFSCHNPQAIPREIQLQLFQRSFSTKGPGRGIGTYSIRLLTERYLGGTVALTSAPETGTRFELSFPKTVQPVTATDGVTAHR
jgi:signal transduction histidine kinase